MLISREKPKHACREESPDFCKLFIVKELMLCAIYSTAVGLMKLNVQLVSKLWRTTKKEWNDRHGCWSSRPLHNFASHGADAFRMLTITINKLISKGLSAEEWESLRDQYRIKKNQQKKNIFDRFVK